MRACADREVVTKSPVIEIVPAAVTTARERGYFVPFVAGVHQQAMALLLNFPTQFIIGHCLRWPPEENRIRLKGKLIVGYVRRS